MLDLIDRRGRLAFALAALGGALALTTGTADAAYTPAIQDRTLTVAGDTAPDKLTLRVPATAPGTLQLDVGDDGTADFSLDRAQFEAVRVLAGAGDDQVRVEDAAIRGASPLPVTIDGQAGNDSLSAARGVSALSGGDGSDRVTLAGTAAGEQLRVAADGPGAARVSAGAIAPRLDGVERVDVAALAGDDTLSVEDLTGTGVQEVRDLGGDGADRLVLDGTPAGDDADVLATGSGSAAVLGLPAFVSVTGADPALDRLTIRGRDGDDRIAAGGSALPLALAADGGAGADQLVGSSGADTLTGGDGKDVVDPGRGDDGADLGAGDDTLIADAGDGRDTVDGQAGKDFVRMSGSSAGETFDVAPSGPRVQLDRASDAIDAGTVEALSLFSFGGADRMNVKDLSGTAVATIDASLFDFAVPGGAQDSVRIDGTGAGDALRVSTAAGATRVTGLPAAVTLTGVTAANDTLELNGLGGADRVDAFDLAPDALRLRADGGADGDTLVGGAGADILSGGDGADIAFAGAGDDVAFGGAGDDLLSGEGGDDVLDGSTGTDRLAGGAGADVLLGGEVVTQD